MMTSVVVEIDYTNQRGERSTRRVVPLRWDFKSTPHHRKMQWMMQAIDLDKNDIRDFAMADIQGWRTPPPTTGGQVGVAAEYAATDMVRDR